jgi:hypothetical protein
MEKVSPVDENEKAFKKHGIIDQRKWNRGL